MKLRFISRVLLTFWRGLVAVIKKKTGGNFWVRVWQMIAAAITAAITAATTTSCLGYGPIF